MSKYIYILRDILSQSDENLGKRYISHVIVVMCLVCFACAYSAPRVYEFSDTPAALQTTNPMFFYVSHDARGAKCKEMILVIFSNTLHRYTHCTYTCTDLHDDKIMMQPRHQY